jgi:hypothetical protein
MSFFIYLFFLNFFFAFADSAKLKFPDELLNLVANTHQEIFGGNFFFGANFLQGTSRFLLQPIKRNIKKFKIELIFFYLKNKQL